MKPQLLASEDIKQKQNEQMKPPYQYPKQAYFIDCP